MALAAVVGLAVALAIAPRQVLWAGGDTVRDVRVVGDEDVGLIRRGRWWWATLAGLGAAVVLGGPLALPAGLAVGWFVGRAAGRIEPPSVRRRQEEMARDLPHVVTLLAAALRAGVGVPAALDAVRDALPGAAATRLSSVAARLRLGADPGETWATLADDPELRALGQALGRAHRTGAPVVGTLEALADDLADRARAEAEDRARSIGVRAAVPLGLCLLPAFLLLGIVPLAVSLAGAVVGTAR